MKRILIRHFGLITAVIMNLLIYLLNSLFYAESVGFINDILGYFWILCISTIIMFIYVKNKKWKLKSLIGYYILFIVIFEKTFGLFLFSLARFLDGFPSYNPDIAIAWIVILPVSIIVFIIIGLLFDYTKNKKLMNNKMSSNE